MAYDATPKQPEKTAATMLDHYFPLRRETSAELEVTASLTIPRDLTMRDAERIGAWLKTLAVPWRDDEPAPSTPTPEKT